MLTVYTGGNGGETRREIEKRVLAARKEGLSVVRVNDAAFSKETIAGFFGESDLFGSRYIIILDRIFDYPGASDFILANLPQFVSSGNEFVLYQEKLTSDELGKIEKEGGKVIKGKTPREKVAERFNVFALSDALGGRDKKRLWVLYQRALRAGVTAEEISGTLFWILKSMMVIAAGGGTTLSPFVKAKAERFLKNFTGEEVSQLGFRLVDIYHRSRRGGLPLQERIEQFILSL